MARFKSKRAKATTALAIQDDSTFEFKSELAIMRYVASGFKHPPEALSQILDNACDANATKVRIAVSKTAKRIVVMYDGDPITKEDMDRIRTGVGKSINKNNTEKLGQFGTGFVTFLSYANKQTVISIGDEGEFVWENEPDEEKEVLASKHRPLQMSEKDKESKFPLIKFFLEKYKYGNYILIEDIHPGKIDAFLGARFKNFMGALWADRLHSTAYTLNEIDYAQIKSKGKLKWKAIKHKKLVGEEFKERVIGSYAEDGKKVEVTLDFDLVVSTKLDDPVRILNRSQPIMTVKATNLTNGLVNLPKKSILRSNSVAGAIRMKEDSLINFERSRIDEYCPKGKAFLDACKKVDESLSKLVDKIEAQEEVKKDKADSEKYTELLNNLCDYIGFKPETDTPIKIENAGEGKKGKQEYRDLGKAMDSLRKRQQKKEKKKNEGKNNKSSGGYEVKLEPFLKEQQHMRFKFTGDVIRVNRDHEDFKAVYALPHKAGHKDNYIVNCMMAVLARITKNEETPIEEEFVKLRTQYSLMKSEQNK